MAPKQKAAAKPAAAKPAAAKPAAAKPAAAKVPAPESNSLEALEKKFSGMAHRANVKLMDLNVPMSEIASYICQVLACRKELLDKYGVPADPKYSPLGAAGGAAGAEEVPWKQKLVEAVARKNGRTIKKEEVTYVTICPDESAKPPKYTSTVSSPLLSSEHVSAEPQPSKRQAESAAAQSALKVEFPEEYQKATGPPKGQKRKADDFKLEGKSLLCSIASKILGRPITKEDISYETEEVAGSDPKKYVSTVSVPAHNKSKYKGDEKESKKDAEHAAANKCVAALEKTCKKVLEEHAAKKARDTKEALEKLVAATKAKKEAKKAA
jgi:hypothetical protein